MLRLDAKVQMTAWCRLIYHLPPLAFNKHTYLPQSRPWYALPLSLCLHGNHLVSASSPGEGADCRLFCWPSAPFSQMEFWENTIFRWRADTHTHGCARTVTALSCLSLYWALSTDPLTALISLHQGGIRCPPHLSCCSANYSHIQLISISS